MADLVKKAEEVANDIKDFIQKNKKPLGWLVVIILTWKLLNDDK